MPSRNDYDWLGDGVYFWEHNASRAFYYARELREHPRNGMQKIKHPAVVGAIIDLGFCLNLLDNRFIDMIRHAHDDLKKLSEEADIQLPKNDIGPDLLARKLDCAVVRFLHQTREEGNLQSFDTVRAAFIEGEKIYENAGFAAKNHIQICVRNTACIRACYAL